MVNVKSDTSRTRGPRTASAAVEGALLDAAERLLAQEGGALSTTRIAKVAGVSVGSLYQYFPDKRAILRTLAEQYTAESRRCIEEGLAEARDKASLAQAFSSLVDRYYAMFLGKPVRRDIIAGMRADKDLMAIELAESQANGAVLAAAIRRVHPRADAKRVDALAFLIWQLGEETMRLALSHKRSEGALLVEAYKRMSLRAIAEP